MSQGILPKGMVPRGFLPKGMVPRGFLSKEADRPILSKREDGAVCLFYRIVA